MTSHSSRVALSVNVNKVALLRNSRHLGIPSVTLAAERCLQAGAQGITIHPRPDERHIRASDVPELTTLMKAWPDREFNIEGNPFHNLMDHVRAVRPHQVTLVPDAEGRFVLRGLPAGPLTMLVKSSEGEVRYSVEMPAKPGVMSGVEFKAPCARVTTSCGAASLGKANHSTQRRPVSSAEPRPARTSSATL